MKLHRIAFILALCLTSLASATVVNVPAGASNAKQLIEGAKAGDKVVFAIGNTACDSAIIPNGVEVAAAERRRSRIVVPDGKFAFRQLSGTSIKITDIRCDGSMLAPEGKCTFNVDGVEVFNFLRGPDVGYGGGMGIGLPNSTQPQNSSVTRSLFTGPGYCGIGYYRADTLLISQNTFNGVKVPIKTNNVGATDNNTTIEKNVFKGASGPVIEAQGCARNFRLFKNIASDFVASGDYSLGFSIIYHGRNSDNNYAGYNIVRGLGAFPRITFEIGDGYLVEQNDVSDANVLAACFMGDSSGPVPPDTIQPTIVRDNRVRNTKLGGLEGGQNPEKFSMSPLTNHANVVLAWNPDVESKTWGDPYTNGAATTQPSDPLPFTVKATNVPNDADSKYTGASVDLSFANAPAGTKSYVIAIQTPDGAFRDADVMRPASQFINGTSGRVTGLRMGWEIAIRCNAMSGADGTGAVLGTTGWVNLGRTSGNVPEDSSRAWPLPTKPTTQPAGDSVDEITTTTTRIRAGKVIDTTSTTVRRAA